MSTGFREVRDGQPHLVYERRFTAPITDVWDSITESERLGRWFGTWTGDPASGRVKVSWTAEEGAPDETYVIEACEPPRRLRVRSENSDPSKVWTLDLALAEDAGVTTLRFAQVVDPTLDVVDVGPGWQYYLDRHGVAMSGGDPNTITWEGYDQYGSHYAKEFGGE